jgi:DNA-binding NarL/FixJ family response regulator
MTASNDTPSSVYETAERVPAAVVIAAEDGTVLHWNRAAETLFGQPAEAVRGKPLETLAEGRTPPAGPAELESLTQRQREVLQLIAEGWPTREIAQRLGLSVKTIETHRAHLMQRLKVDSVARLVRYAVSVGLVPAQP